MASPSRSCSSSRPCNDLKIDLLGTGTSTTVSNWFSGSAGALQEITAGGLKIDSQISQLVQAMATYSANNAGFGPSNPSIQLCRTTPRSKTRWRRHGMRRFEDRATGDCSARFELRHQPDFEELPDIELKKQHLEGRFDLGPIVSNFSRTAAMCSCSGAAKQRRRAPSQRAVRHVGRVQSRIIAVGIVSCQSRVDHRLSTETP